MSHEDSAIPWPWVSRLAKLNGYGMDKWWGCNKRLSIIWWLTYSTRIRWESTQTVVTNNDQEVILNYLRSNITPPCSLLDSLEKRPSWLRMWLVYFKLSLVQVHYNRILKIPIFHITAGTTLESLNTAGVSQLSPWEAHDPGRQSPIAGHPTRLGS